MADSDKVISGLQRCRLMNKINCDKCPYDYNGRGNGKSECTAELAEDVLALLKEQEHKDRMFHALEDDWKRLKELLKEQEAVEPYVTGRGKSFETAETWWYECGNCNKPIDPNDRYCRYCGRSVKWE